ncbi:MAG TPA: 2-oxoacid:acceptor oxidoreductase family protein [Candidatus Limnocylindrales bacterium]|jgi:pyruvate-ferredoxin/flavodoxin oxidoreductase
MSNDRARTSAPDPSGALYPGQPVIVDGSEAIASVETRISEVACAYPITPSTTMAALYQSAVAEGRQNLWGVPLRFIEPESEHSSASAAEGVALSGGRVTNFTAGQGLILMKEVLYVIAGKRLPAVFHVGARALTSQGLNIHAGHDDVMGVADTGWGILFARNAQEAADLTAIARRTAERGETPFLVVQDGFLTTHTMENVRLPEDSLLRDYVGDPRDAIRDLFEPRDAFMTGVVQNQDSYMKGRIGQRAWYDRLPAVLAEAMSEWTELTGRAYRPVVGDRCDDATEIIVAMGTIADTARAVVRRLRAEGRRVGCLAVTSFRPFPAAEIAAAIGQATAIAVVERTDEPAAADGPLTREVKAALYGRTRSRRRTPRIIGVAAGLGSRDVAPDDLAGVFARLTRRRDDRSFGVLGIRHPLAIERAPVDIRPPGTYSLRGHSIGGFGSVTTNKLLATIAGELFGLQVQAYPRYGSEKKGLPTTFFLSIADEPLHGHAELDQVDFVPLHGVAAFQQGAPLQGLVDGGTVFLSSPLEDPAAIWSSIPVAARSEILTRGIRVNALDTAGLARAQAPRPDLVVRMQGVALVGVFLRVSPLAARAGLDRPALMAAVHRQLWRFYGKRGGRVVAANQAVIEAAYDGVIDVTAAISTPIPAGPPATEHSITEAPVLQEVH